MKRSMFVLVATVALAGVAVLMAMPRLSPKLLVDQVRIPDRSPSRSREQAPRILTIAIDDAALSARDAQGNEVGIDPRSGAVLSSIPGSSAWADRLDDDLTGARGVVTTSFVYVPNAASVYNVEVIPIRSGTSVLLVDLQDSIPSSSVQTKVSLLAMEGVSVTLTLSVTEQAAPSIVRAGGFAGARQDVAAALQLGLIKMNGEATALQQQLERAEAAYQRGKHSASLGYLKTFDDEVRAQSGDGIDILAAEILLADSAGLRLLVIRP